MDYLSWVPRGSGRIYLSGVYVPITIQLSFTIEYIFHGQLSDVQGYTKQTYSARLFSPFE